MKIKYYKQMSFTIIDALNQKKIWFKIKKMKAIFKFLHSDVILITITLFFYFLINSLYRKVKK